MPYIGRDLNRGNYLKLDDISSSFNGSTQTFNLTVGGSAFRPGSAFSILVSVGGVIQEPESAYQVNNSEITFANAPTAQDSFFCIALGVALGIGVPGNGTVNGTQMAKPFNYDGFFYLDDANNRVGIGSLQPKQALDVIGNANISGILTASSFSGGSGGINAGVVTCTGLDVNGNGDISGNLVLGGDLTVNGTTTTLDTNLIGVDRIEVGANSSTVVGVAVTQSGTADLVRLYDGASQVVTIDDTGNVGLGSATPASLLNLASSNPLIRLTDTDSGSYSTIGGDGGNLYLYTNSTGRDFIFRGTSEVARITGDGKLGIGTHTPQKQLQILGDSDTCIRVTSSAGGAASLQLGDTSDTVKGAITFLNSDNSLRIRGHNNDDRIVITSDGRIGINDGTPNDYELDILKRSTATDAQIRLYNNATGSGNDTVMRYQIAGTTASNYIYFGDGDDSNVGQIRYSHNTDSMQFFTGGAERLRIDSGGNVSQVRIGSQAATDTTSYEIQLSGNANNDSILSLYNPTTNNGEGIQQGFFFKNSNDTVTEFARIESTAIETTAATAKGDLRFKTRSGSGGLSNASERLRITSGGSVNIGGDYSQTSVTAQITGDLLVQKTASAYLNPNIDIYNYVNGGYAGSLTFSGKMGGSKYSQARIRAYGGSNTSDGALAIECGNMNEKLRIDSSGRVLIGSTAKAGDSALQVYTSDKLHPAIRTNSTSANGYTMFSDAYTSGESQVNMGIAYSSASLVLSVGCKVNTSNDDAYVSSQGTYSTRPTVLRLDTDGSLSFLNRASASTTPTDNAVTLTERLRITSAGNVGIGTDNPTVKLTVSSTSPAVCDIHHIDGGTNDEARIILGALAANPPSNRGAGIAALNNGAGHDLLIKCSTNHSSGPSEKVRIGSSGQIGLGGANYGTAGQVLKSGGASAAASWGAAGGNTETYARVVFGAVYDTNSGYIVHNITSGSSNGITIDTTNEKVTPTVAGTYLVIYNAHWGGLHSSGATYYNRITKNGSEIYSSNFSAYNSGTHMHTLMTTSSMNGSSDYFQFEFYENKSGAAAYVNHKSRAVVILLDT